MSATTLVFVSILCLLGVVNCQDGECTRVPRRRIHFLFCSYDVITIIASYQCSERPCFGWAPLEYQTITPDDQDGLAIIK